MVASLCPTCNSPIDPARAPVARVRGTKIVTFCSARCADAAPDEEDAASPPDRDATRRTRAGTAADTAGVEDFTPSRRRGSRRRQIIALSAAIMAGGMVITVINAVSPSTPSDVRAAERHLRTPAVQDPAARDAAARAEPAEPAEDQAPALELTPEALYEKARSTLRQLMESPSERVQRIAAMALARDGDKEALALLQEMLDRETVDLRKIDLAYALARAGDIKAQKLLRRRLKHKRRDVRLDAARALMQLDDESGTGVLVRMLDLRSHRLGAAALLARMGDQRGVITLRRELEDDSSSEETRMRAAVALGRAGDDTVRQRLLALLEDRRYHVGAADALAVLGDEAAVPALEKQLVLPSLCVRAALSLRRLNAAVELDGLAQILATGNEPARVSAAEAIMILTGPRGLAERD